MKEPKLIVNTSKRKGKTLGVRQAEVFYYLDSIKPRPATKQEIYDNIKFGYYHNEMKHLGELLSRMIKAGLIKRVGRNQYQAENLKMMFQFPVIPNQTKLFNK